MRNKIRVQSRLGVSVPDTDEMTRSDKLRRSSRCLETRGDQCSRAERTINFVRRIRVLERALRIYVPKPLSRRIYLRFLRAAVLGQSLKCKNGRKSIITPKRYKRTVTVQ